METNGGAGIPAINFSEGDAMTAQVTDVLSFDGDEYAIHNEPLEAYFDKYPPRPEIEASCSACWRGYVATWRIKRSKLYLQRLDDFSGKLLKLKKELFPNEEGPVFASWFTGPLICPNGPEVQYIHMGYESTFEKYLIIEIENGLVTKTMDLSLDEYKQWQKNRFE
mgnify:CR=1 FL=1